MSTLNLNLNDRERKRFAGMFRELAGAAEKLAVTIEAEPKDLSIIVEFTLFTMMAGGLKEFQELIVDAAKQAKDEPEFPSVIGG